ncbi:OmpA family protein [Ferruginibacter sp. SUN002]|uniref:OmpA family protein n=1 Tax=Ferruginibacter sp. SUN002 TaxID=2937789 RepID=UPI003D35B9FA
MKKIMLSFAAFVLCINTFAQNEYKKPASIGVHFFYDDFQTASEIRATSLSEVLKDNEWSKTSRMAPGFAVSYIKGLSDHADLATTLSGSFLDYPIPNKSSFVTKHLLLELAATANLKLTSDKYWVSPFLTLGVGASKYKDFYGAFIPAGVGIQVNLFDNAYVLLNSQYRMPVTENVAYHFYHSFGIAGPLYEAKPKPKKPLPVAPVVEAPKDSDSDGVLDVDDLCPDVKGLATLKGCPDTDGDGITDADDKCPSILGLAKYNGCPIPDSDRDGINDENDKCATVAGVARYGGCPVPDTDNDGINDEEDKCPSEAGIAANYGCPEIAKAVVDKINVAAKNIFFASGSAKLLPKSFKSLNEVVKILKENPTYNLDIDGYTDNSGKADKNQTLSESRAKAVVDYLKSKGITEDRLVAAGHGQEDPIADNKTAAGRAQNRRVELKARNY